MGPLNLHCKCISKWRYGPHLIEINVKKNVKEEDEKGSDMISLKLAAAWLPWLREGKLPLMFLV